MGDTYLSLCDGYAKNNGSYKAEAGGSYAIFKVDSLEDALVDVTLLKDPLIHVSKFNFINFEGEKISTNNGAEALSIFALLLELINRDILNPNNRHLILSDSNLIITQILGLSKINNVLLKKIHRKIQEVFINYRKQYGEIISKSLRIQHIPGDIMKKTIIGH